MGTKYALEGSGIVPFQMELGGVLRIENVLWVLELKRSVLSISLIENKGLYIIFQDGKVLIKPSGSILDVVVVLGVRGRNLYRLNDKPMQAMTSTRVITNRE